MKGYSATFTNLPIPADVVAAGVLTAATASVFDMPAGAGIMRVSGATTAGAVYGFALNIGTTGAQWPAASYAATTATSNLAAVVPPGESRTFQVSTGSTGFSIISGTSGIVTIEFWKKGG